MSRSVCDLDGERHVAVHGDCQVARCRAYSGCGAAGRDLEAGPRGAPIGAGDDVEGVVLRIPDRPRIARKPQHLRRVDPSHIHQLHRVVVPTHQEHRVAVR